jgi:hypothetical protein
MVQSSSLDLTMPSISAESLAMLRMNVFEGHDRAVHCQRKAYRRRQSQSGACQWLSLPSPSLVRRRWLWSSVLAREARSPRAPRRGTQGRRQPHPQQADCPESQPDPRAQVLAFAASERMRSRGARAPAPGRQAPGQSRRARRE